MIGIYPDYEPILKEFESMINWKNAGRGKGKVPEPVLGLDADFDAANQKIERIKEKMQDYLEEIAEKI